MTEDEFSFEDQEFYMPFYSPGDYALLRQCVKDRDVMMPYDEYLKRSQTVKTNIISSGALFQQVPITCDMYLDYCLFKGLPLLFKFSVDMLTYMYEQERVPRPVIGFTDN